VDKATGAAYQEMLCVENFVFDTKNNCLKIQPNFDSKHSLKSKAFLDSELEIRKQGLV
jgi:hypothetical protein